MEPDSSETSQSYEVLGQSSHSQNQALENIELVSTDPLSTPFNAAGSLLAKSNDLGSERGSPQPSPNYQSTDRITLDDRYTSDPCLTVNSNENNQINEPLKEIHWTGHMAVITLGMGVGWVVLDAMFVEVPYMQERLPEGLKLASRLTVAGGLPQVTVIPAYLLFTSLYFRINYSWLTLGVLLAQLSTVLVLITAWDATIGQGSSEISLPLMLSMFTVGCCGHLQTSAVIPYLSVLDSRLIASLLTGSNLGSLTASAVALFQSPGQKHPMFGARLYYSLFLIHTLAAGIAYLYLAGYFNHGSILSSWKNDRLEIVNEDEMEEMEEMEAMEERSLSRNEKSANSAKGTTVFSSDNTQMNDDKNDDYHSGYLKMNGILTADVALSHESIQRASQSMSEMRQSSLTNKLKKLKKDIPDWVFRDYQVFELNLINSFIQFVTWVFVRPTLPYAAVHSVDHENGHQSDKLQAIAIELSLVALCLGSSLAVVYPLQSYLRLIFAVFLLFTLCFAMIVFSNGNDYSSNVEGSGIILVLLVLLLRFTDGYMTPLIFKEVSDRWNDNCEPIQRWISFCEKVSTFLGVWIAAALIESGVIRK